MSQFHTWWLLLSQDDKEFVLSFLGWAGSSTDARKMTKEQLAHVETYYDNLPNYEMSQ